MPDKPSLELLVNLSGGPNRVVEVPADATLGQVASAWRYPRALVEAWARDGRLQTTLGEDGRRRVPGRVMAGPRPHPSGPPRAAA